MLTKLTNNTIMFSDGSHAKLTIGEADQGLPLVLSLDFEIRSYHSPLTLK
jgi:hypothetical protein